MTTIGLPIPRLLGFGISRGREMEAPLAAEKDVTIFYDKPLELLPRKVECGPGIGEVLLNPDGSVIVDERQMIRYTGYEVENNLSPADIKPLPGGRYMISMRK